MFTIYFQIGMGYQAPVSPTDLSQLLILVKMKPGHAQIYLKNRH